jgi:hypothetical protein
MPAAPFHESRMLRSTLAAAALLLSLASAAADSSATAVDVAQSAARIEADVRFLADDLLEGREAGTRGYDLAALYVATQYRRMGLQPGGENGSYFQTVPLLRGTRLREGAKLAIVRNGVTTEFAFQDDFIPSQTYDTDSCSVASAPMVFVAQAIHAPELQQDDFAGVDLRGKIAVVLANAPARFPNDQRAFYADWDEKARELERRGAIGVILVSDPVLEKKRAWEIVAGAWQQPGMRVVGDDGRPIDSHAGLKCVARLRASRADALFSGSPYDAAAVFDMLAKDKLRPFDLTGTAQMASRTKLERVTSRNVVGRVAAARNPLASEHVLLTAHLDHLGIGPPKNGDPIYNGAQDNAVGIAAMLEAGRLLMRHASTLNRSVLLVATTAEEKWLRGAQYFAAHPTVPIESIVANVNLDGPIVRGEVTDVIPVGIEHSTLDAVAREAVRMAGFTLTPDPMPDEVLFIRSDQYPLVRAGVPAIFLIAGIHRKDGADGLRDLRDYFSNTYHLPNDDLNQPIDWPGAAKLAAINFNIAYAIATQKERPAWKPGDFFGDKFGRRERK